jgi:serine/threonine protein kinase
LPLHRIFIIDKNLLFRRRPVLNAARVILLSREGEVKLADFGIARAIGHGGAGGPGNEILGGTPGFIAPEMLTGQVDRRADIYSLGVTLFAALSGEAPERPQIDLRALEHRIEKYHGSAVPFEGACLAPKPYPFS